jgi:putative transposase
MNEGQFYHVYHRGNNRQRIFFEPKNYQYFLEKFQKYVCPVTDVYAYCLMPNHFHFLIQVHEQPLIQHPSDLLVDYKSKKLSPIEKGFKDFFISYAKSINKAYHRTGSLFQSRFRRKIITDENYMSTIIPYIHLNPVRAGITSNVYQYAHSSFNEFWGWNTLL